MKLKKLLSKTWKLWNRAKNHPRFEFAAVGIPASLTPIARGESILTSMPQRPVDDQPIHCRSPYG